MPVKDKQEADSKYSIFDVAGPVMVGPSSSHTAGACKIGQMARALFHGKPEKVTFILHGSFGTVFKGHATDRALLSGVMRRKTSDDRMKNAFREAKKIGLEYKYIIEDLGKKYHPNTVKIILEKKGRRSMSMIGSSIGGGVIRVVKIDQFDVSIKGIAGYYKSLVVWHDNEKSALKPLLKEIKNQKIRIHDIQTTRVGKKALSIINMEGRRLKLAEIMEMERFPGIREVRALTSPDRE